MEKHRIIITVEGGIIQDIRNIPPGIVIEVRDYDCEGIDEIGPLQPGTDRDEHGSVYAKGEWEA
jgi:hypothetical protein